MIGDWIEDYYDNHPHSGLKANSLAVISVKDDNMDPDLYNGDLILTDYSETTLEDSRIYALRFSEGLFVKRIQQLPGGKVHLVSENRSYPPIVISYPEADGLVVVGRVVASMYEW